MGTKLIIKLKSYLNNIWLEEIIYLIFYLLYIVNDFINNFDSVSEFTGYRGSNSYRINFVIFTCIAIFLSIKIIRLICMGRTKEPIRHNLLTAVLYIFKNGFKYKSTKKTLKILITINITIFIIYLYLIAIGNYGTNILARFFSIYPIKGIFIVLIIPTVAILFVVKKDIEVSKINEKIINNSILDLKKDINSETSIEILDLIKNISILKASYEDAVEETLKNERLKTELISNVSHDLRTPLTSIINYVNILKEDELTGQEKDDYLNILDRKSKKLKVLIDDLFEMSKINSGKIILNKEKIDIVSLIHQNIGEYSSIYEDKNVSFNVDSYQDVIYMNLDGKMISRAIENVVINAIKYSMQNTRIYVDILSKNNNIVISFKNISNYYMDFDSEEIFERFARGDKSRTSKVEGSGLGLAITKSIVELHSGSVKVQREADMFKIFIFLPLDNNN